MFERARSGKVLETKLRVAGADTLEGVARLSVGWRGNCCVN